MKIEIPTTVEIEELSQQIQPLLHGKGILTQGAVLADLMSLWLAGQLIPGDAVKTKLWREKQVELLLESMWKLVDVNEDILRRKYGLSANDERLQ